MNNDLTKDEKIGALVEFIPEGAKSAKAYLSLIKGQIMGVDKNGKERPFDDLMYFMSVSKRTGLDPLSKQIYAVYRWSGREQREVMSIQVGIDGLRLIAHRSGLYGGQDDTIYDPADESAKYPKKATAIVYRINQVNGNPFPVKATARWDEYVQTYKNSAGQYEVAGQWATKPYLMLAKCAEALALRKAFPAELSGVYIQEEITERPAQDIETSSLDEEPRNEQDEFSEAKTKILVCAEDLKKIKKLMKDTNKSKKWLELVLKKYEIDDLSKLPSPIAGRMIKSLEDELFKDEK